MPRKNLEFTLEGRDQHIADVAKTIQWLLESANKLPERHIKRFWNEMLWDATEYPSKGHTRYVSRKAMQNLRKAQKLKQSVKRARGDKLKELNEQIKKLRVEHHHIWSKKWLKSKLLEENANILQILTKYAWACTLTKKEHSKLKGKADGWGACKKFDIYDTFLKCPRKT